MRPLRAALAAAERELDARNCQLTGAAAVRLRALDELLARGRRPRIALVGRRGAGKSSLVNALCEGARATVGDVVDATTRAERYEGEGALRGVDLWDLPGLRAAGQPERGAQVAALAAALAPDALLAVFQASEVDAGVDDDLADLRAVRDAIERGPFAQSARGVPLGVVAVVNKVDELAPPDVPPPFDDEAKRAAIARAVAVLTTHARRTKTGLVSALPCAAYQRFEGSARVEDLRWNLDALAARAGALARAGCSAPREAHRAELAARLALACDDLGAAFGALAVSAWHRAARDRAAKGRARDDGLSRWREPPATVHAALEHALAQIAAACEALADGPPSAAPGRVARALDDARGWAGALLATGGELERRRAGRVAAAFRARVTASVARWPADAFDVARAPEGVGP